ncbi:uncharacterized protein RCC_02097 [Ramularia collo-cygni]|uniref:Uncharacterized protein n=1 Tax=Ramularia collo-cygni TaxID=112498 RepID=A0A2D3URQ3_9PEZI|nr:uncharacterized protein RCC_02097 [Ramularia collo-cygni]CZT16255.1 uncharacterized protein RCC_02097 [Ramularia collo-cygni]
MKYSAALILATGLLANSLPTADIDGIEKRTFFPIMDSALKAKCALNAKLGLPALPYCKGNQPPNNSPPGYSPPSHTSQGLYESSNRDFTNKAIF